MEQEFQEITLASIGRNPFNPRQEFNGADFDELVASVREKGVISPVLVRPVPEAVENSDDTFPTFGNKIKFQLVYGERRMRAKCLVANENGGLEENKIPALVRDLTDDEVFDIMTIENLQRKDLTPLEEAQSFRMYQERHGRGAVPKLSKKTGICQKYIRRRLAVLDLPKSTLKAWDRGLLKFGHVEQLSRLKNKKQIAELTGEIIEARKWREDYSIGELKHSIENDAPELKNAKFNVEKAGCNTCQHNSDIQKEKLGDLGDMGKKTHCLDPNCFKQKQTNHLTKNWKKTGYYKQHGTNGFRWQEDVDYQDREVFHNKAPKKCKECPDFITLLWMNGNVFNGQVCIGDKNCYGKAIQVKTAKKKSAAGSSEEDTGPRVAWHGEYFREKFYETAIPECFEALLNGGLMSLQLVLLSLLKSNQHLHNWFADYVGLNEDTNCWFTLSSRTMLDAIATMDEDRVVAALKKAAGQVVMQDQFGAHARRIVADYLGIDLQKEWRLNEEYLNKKTVKEMLVLGEDLNVFSDPKAQTFLHEQLGKKFSKFNTCRKPELIRVFLESGVDLAGKVPQEIID